MMKKRNFSVGLRPVMVMQGVLGTIIWLSATTISRADRDSILGTIDGSGNFTGGRSSYDATDGKIKEVESHLQADPSTENPLDSKVYHLRADCYGDTLIPLGKFSSGTLTLNWSTWGSYASVSGNMVIGSHWGDASTAGPFILSQQEGASSGRVKLRVLKGVSGDYDGFYLFLQYDNVAPSGTPQTVSVSIATTQNIATSYAESSYASATVVPVFSTISTDTKQFQFSKDVYVNGSKVLTEGAAPNTSAWTGVFARRQMGTDSVLASGGLVAWGDGAEAIGSFSAAIGAAAVADATEAVALNGGGSHGDYSFSSGYGIADGQLAVGMAGGVAHGEGSIAIGGYDTTQWSGPNTASGENATALGGIGNVAAGFSSFSSGYWTTANSAYSIALGSMNVGSAASSISWVDTDPLLELGNGIATRSSSAPSPALRSNAITTLKNGQTTLANKFWSSTTPKAVPTATGSSAGNALIVNGHSILNGNVIISQPQGDISAGIYGD